jgi:CDP-4-dehydro-6-deoxyglucose reductase
METPIIRSIRIDSIQHLTTSVLEFTFSLPNSSPMHFQAGQYGSVIIDASTRRQYSFCSSPKQTETIHIVIDTKPMGPGSQYFLGKKAGDTIQLLAPLGTFTLTPSPRKKIMIATGTGIAPLKSMILDIIGTADIQLLWGLRHEEDIYWKEEFNALTKQYPTFSYVISLSQPSEGWQGTRGRVTDHIQSIGALRECDYYICGNKQMVSDVKNSLLVHAVAADHIQTELF